jgi:DisA bacterial checkpoint controller nucleotide-binding
MRELFNINREVVEEICKQYLLELQEKFDNLNEDSLSCERIVLKSLIDLPVESFEQIIKIVIFSSFEKEESRFHNFELTISPPFPEDWFNDSSPEVLKPFIFSDPPKLRLLPKLAPALEFTNQSINVWLDKDNEPVIWGFGDSIMPYDCIKIKTFSAGKVGIFLPTNPNSSSNLVLVSLEKTEFLDTTSCFYPILIQNEDMEEFRKLCKILANAIESESDLVEEYDKEKSTRQKYRLDRKSEIFKKLAIKMRQHSHGGTLLVLFNSENWKNSIQEPIPFKPSSKFTLIRQRFIDDEEDYMKSIQSKNHRFSPFRPPPIDNDLQIVSQVTAVDGATLITNEFDLIAFGAKIKPINADNKPNELIVTEPFENSNEETKELANLGGTRHQSAAQFVYDQKDSFAIVVSQDGKISVMYWDKKIEKVRVIQHTEYLFA